MKCSLHGANDKRLLMKANGIKYIRDRKTRSLARRFNWIIQQVLELIGALPLNPITRVGPIRDRNEHIGDPDRVL